MATQILGDFGKLEVSGTIVRWDHCRGYGSIIAAYVQESGEEIKMILFPGHSFIKGDLKKREEDVMVDKADKKVTVQKYLEDTAIYQEKFLGEGERPSIEESIRREVGRAMIRLQNIL